MVPPGGGRAKTGPLSKAQEAERVRVRMRGLRERGKVGTIVLCHAKWSSLGLAGVVLSHHSLLTQPLLTQP